MRERTIVTTRRRLLGTTTAAGGVLVVAACGPAADGGTPKAAPKPATVGVVIQAGLPTATAYKKMAAEFSAANPHVTVAIDETPLPAGVNQEGKLKALLAAGQAPDVAQTQMASAVLFAKLSAVHALDKLISASKLSMKTLVHSSLEPGTKVDGKVTNIPSDLQAFVVWLNKDHFAAKGVPLPRADWTWQDLAEASRRLTSGSGAEKVWGFQADMFWSRFEPWIYQSGGTPFNQVNFPTRCTIDQPQPIASMQFLQDMIVKQQVMMSPQEKTDWSRANNAYNFPWRKAAVAMEFGHTNGLSTFPQELTFKYDPWPLPRQAKAATTMVVNSMIVFNTTRSLDASWDFVRFVVSDAGVKYTVNDSEKMPARKDLAERLFVPFAKQKAGVSNPQPFIDAFDYGYPQTNTPVLFKAQDDWLRAAWVKMMDRGESVKDVMTEGARSINEWLKEFA